MRLVLVVAAALAAAVTPARAEAPARWWSFVPPSGWTDTTADNEARVAAALEHAPMQIRADGVVAFDAPDGSDVLVYGIRGPGANGNVLSVASQVENGARDSIRRELNEQHYARRAEPTMLVADQVVTAADGTRSQFRRFAGVDHGGNMVAVIATCNGEESTCATALDGLRGDAGALRPLSSGKDRGQYSSAYALGQGIGTLMVFGLVAWYLVRRHRQKKAAAARTEVF